jgi:aldehyde reductase
MACDHQEGETIKSLRIMNPQTKIQSQIWMTNYNVLYLQVECHPYLNQTKLIAFCKERGIVVTAYSPLGSPNTIAKEDLPAPLKDPKLQGIANKHGKTVAQIILRYLVSA